MGGVDLAAETQSLYGFLSELFPNTLPRKGMETLRRANFFTCMKILYKHTSPKGGRK